jgi:pimeloyl-ACP methyl ester carboxylesterase
LLRAAEYFRAAEYYGLTRDPATRELGMESRDCFERAMPLLGHHAETVVLPFEQKSLPAYFLSPDGSGRKRPTVMIMSGFDGTNEELYFQGGLAGVERGFNVLLFAGPGQVSALRFHPDMVFRPDWEAVVSVFLDELLRRDSVDPDRIGLVGISLGGYFASRAAAYEPRVKALVANSPIVDLFRYIAGFMGGPEAAESMEDFTLEELASAPDDLAPPEIKQSTTNMMTRFGRERFSELLAHLKEFRLAPEDLARINRPVLGMVGAGEGDEAVNQAETFRAGVAGPAMLHQFTAEQGASAHCQVDNYRLAFAVLYDFLTEALDADL